MKSIVLIAEKTGTGYSAFAENFPVSTTGEDIPELKSNVIDTIDTWFEHKNIPLANETGISLQFDLPPLKCIELV